MKRGLVEKLKVKSEKLKVDSVRPQANHVEDRQLSTVNCQLSTLMTCHHCIRYANGLCPKITGKPVGPLFIRNGENGFRLEFDCKKCLMYVSALD